MSTQGTSINVGRNVAHELRRALEVRNGYLHEYVAIWDEDVDLRGACHEGAVAPLQWLHAPLPEGYITSGAGGAPQEAYAGVPRAQGPPCFRAMEAWALALLPAVLTPSVGGGCIAPFHAVTRVYNWDMMSVYFHHRALDTLLPFETMFERYSYYTGALSINHYAALYFAGRVASSSLVWDMNARHREYPKGVAYWTPRHCEMGLKWLLPNEGLLTPSLAGTVRWECSPCQWGEEGMAAALAAWGSLDWVHGVGRGGGAFPLTRQVPLSGEAVGDWCSPGLVGAQPRAAPPYSTRVKKG